MRSAPGVQRGAWRLLRQLTKRFGSLPADVIARIQQADTLELEQWADRILDATSLEDMFAEQPG